MIDQIKLKEVVETVVSHLKSTLSSNSTSQLSLFWHDGDTFGVDGTQVDVLEKTDQVRLTTLS